VRKEGPAFDLPIALALLAYDGQVPTKPLAEFVMLGELALDGTLRAVAGTLPMLIAAKRANIARAIVPLPNRAEAALIPGIETYAVTALADAVAVVLGNGASSESELRCDRRMTQLTEAKTSTTFAGR